MRARVASLFGLLTLLSLLFVTSSQIPSYAQTKSSPRHAKNKVQVRPWSLEEMEARLDAHLDDPCLQYVWFQLKNRLPRKKPVVELHAGESNPELPLYAESPRPERPVSALSLFSGSLAVQESLQLDYYFGESDNKSNKTVKLSKLKGPSIKSHPWKKMLQGKQRPTTSALSNMVPENFYLVEFRSLTRMLDVLDEAKLWTKYITTQGGGESFSTGIVERIKKRLAIQTNKLMRPFYDQVISGVAITGSDLYLKEGSDVTLIFRLKQPRLFKARMDRFLKVGRRSEYRYRDVPYVHVKTADRSVHVYSAYPSPGVHVRSNSEVAMKRVIDAIQGKTKRLGATDELAFVRTLMPRKEKDEDGIIYLSDAFVRHMVGPRLRLTELRRMVGKKHLQMIAYASTMFRTEKGRSPKSLKELYQAKCCPEPFNQGRLKSPFDGKYSLSKDGTTGVCSVLGTAYDLTPCCELLLPEVTESEAKAYRSFVEEYSEYWTRYFDPIAIRVKQTEKKTRIETVVLPLIDNSIYSAMRSFLAEKTTKLDVLPTPSRNIFSLHMSLNKKALIKGLGELGNLTDLEDEEVKLPQQAKYLIEQFETFLMKGLSDQFGIHIYDNFPRLNDNWMRFFGELTAGLGSDDELGFSSLMLLPGAALFTPGYISIDVKDRKIVDDCLQRLDFVFSWLTRNLNSLGLELKAAGVGVTFAQMREARTGALIRNLGVRWGAFKFRVFWSRIGDAIYISNQAHIIKDLARMSVAGEKRIVSRSGEKGHAQFKLRIANWKQVMSDFRLGWAENNQQSCQSNLELMDSLARAIPLAQKERMKKTHRLTDLVRGRQFYCPEGGRYHFTEDGKHCQCSIHGWSKTPKVPFTTSENEATTKLTSQTKEITATLSILKHGLRGVVLIERK